AGAWDRERRIIRNWWRGWCRSSSRSSFIRLVQHLRPIDKGATDQGDLMRALLAVLLLSTLSVFSYGQTTAAQDATELEEQYKTCAKHSIPSDKCTPEIYQQLKAKDNA